jgi:SAM-dependent methyltransferase
VVLSAHPPQEVIWHDLECGSYRADLPLWRELATQCSGRVLDIGAGTGRVALDLARAGHSVTAVELDPVLLSALSERVGDLDVEPVCADARSFELSRHDFALCLVPMQTIQLLGGASERVRALKRARAHLRPGGLLACAILCKLEPFDCADGEIGPRPEAVRVDGALYVSRPLRVAERAGGVLIERERRVLGAESAGASGNGGAEGRPDGRLGPAQAPVHDVIELDLLSAAELEREAVEAGLLVEPAREVAPTKDHVGSKVVMLRA